MVSIKPQVEQKEIDFDSMELVVLSDPPELESADTMDSANLEKNTEFAKPDIAAKTKSILVAFWENVVNMKRVFQDQWHQYCCGGSQVERTRAYHVWPGNNVFVFRGRLICGPDPKGLLLTAISISLSSWIFTNYVAEDLPKHSVLIITFSVILTIIVLINLVMVSMIDPGIIPRNDDPFLEEVGTSDRIRTKITIINGVEVKLKYCQICNIFRPPRSCHCAVCDNCVEKFDHHCPWIGQCIGLRNYRYYLTFLATALIFFVYTFAFSCQRMQQRMLQNKSGLFGIFKNHAETLALASFSFTAALFAVGLACYHMRLVALNQTAYENFRERYVSSKNPYDRGILNNINEILLMGMPRSRVDFRAEVTHQCGLAVLVQG